MALETMITKLAKAREEYNQKLKELGDSAAQKIAEYLGPLIPPGHTLQWDQYTPYFNDGEPCTFSIHEPYLVPEDVEPGSSLYNDGIEIGTAMDRYGRPDEEKTYETTDHGNYRLVNGQREYGKKTFTYTEKGFPAIEGYSKETLQQLQDAWRTLPEDMLEKAFGDHARVVITPAGEYEVDECSHD